MKLFRLCTQRWTGCDYQALYQWCCCLLNRAQSCLYTKEFVLWIECCCVMLWIHGLNYSNKPTSGKNFCGFLCVGLILDLLETESLKASRVWSEIFHQGFSCVGDASNHKPTTHTPTLKFSINYCAHVADLCMTS